MTKWIKIAGSAAELPFNEQGLAELEAAGKLICLVRSNGKLCAVSAKCPHASGRLASGFVDALGNIVCPLHRYKFDPENGRNVSGEGYYLKHWPVEERADGVFVGFKEGLFG